MPQIKANAFASRPIASRSMVISSISKSRRKLFPMTTAIPVTETVAQGPVMRPRLQTRQRTAPLGEPGQPRKPLYSHYRRAASAKASNSELVGRQTSGVHYCSAERGSRARSAVSGRSSNNADRNSMHLRSFNETCKRGSQKTCFLRNGSGHPMLPWPGTLHWSAPLDLRLAHECLRAFAFPHI